MQHDHVDAHVTVCSALPCAGVMVKPGLIVQNVSCLKQSISSVISTKVGMCVLQRVMNARQFGLKLIANVTYGYTSAGFSGRMPMAEIADSIVQVWL